MATNRPGAGGESAAIVGQPDLTGSRHQPSKLFRVLDWLLFPVSAGLITNVILGSIAGVGSCLVSACLSEPPKGLLTTLVPIGAALIAAVVKSYFDLKE